MGNGPDAAMSAGRPSDPPALDDSGEVERAASDKATARSAVIEALAARGSSVPDSGPYAAVADAVLAANQSAAAAELRVARLKAEARSRNWLPSLGPSVSLTSLGSIATGLLLDQVLFDNGRRKAERDYAAADVEVAAVTLADDLNARVHDGLARHVEGEMASAQGAVAARGVDRMAEYARIAEARAEGGIADRSEASAIAQKLAELRRIAAADREAGITAQAELAALAGGTAPQAGGLSDLHTVDAVPLAVLKAEAEAVRMRAEARIARAGHLPGIKASAGVADGSLDAGVNLGADRLLNLGTGSELEALKAVETVAAQRVEEARDNVQRRITALEREIAMLESERTETAALVAQTAEGVHLYEQQHEFGRRSLLDLAGLVETQIRLERDLAGLPYKIALKRLQVALVRGTLVSGAEM
jgi:adhesin transport system outer membrane protein